MKWRISRLSHASKFGDAPATPHVTAPEVGEVPAVGYAEGRAGAVHDAKYRKT